MSFCRKAMGKSKQSPEFGERLLFLSFFCLGEAYNLIYVTLLLVGRGVLERATWHLEKAYCTFFPDDHACESGQYTWLNQVVSAALIVSLLWDVMYLLCGVSAGTGVDLFARGQISVTPQGISCRSRDCAKYLWYLAYPVLPLLPLLAYYLDPIPNIVILLIRLLALSVLPNS